MKHLIKTVFLLPIFLFFLQCAPRVDHATSETAITIVATGGVNPEVEKVIELARQFRSLLSEAQLNILQLPYSKTNAEKWSNFPNPAHPVRVGISFGELDSTQLKAAKQLLAYVLDEQITNEGFDEVEGILAADDLLHTLPNKARTFSSDYYFLAFLGEPDTTGTWELQFGGHHLAVSNTYQNGQLVGMTPSFRGVEPMTSIEGANGRHYEPMEQEKRAFVNLLAALTEEERQAAKLSASFSDILLGPGKDNAFPTDKEGLQVGQLSKEKQDLVMEAIGLYVKDIKSSEADELLETYAEQIAETYIAFSGSITMGEIGDYIRIDGPRVWIEFNTQPSRDMKVVPTHPHSIWRDRQSDYGGQ